MIPDAWCERCGTPLADPQHCPVCDPQEHAITMKRFGRFSCSCGANGSAREERAHAYTYLTEPAMWAGVGAPIRLPAYVPSSRLAWLGGWIRDIVSTAFFEITMILFGLPRNPKTAQRPEPRWAHDRTCDCPICRSPRSLRKRIVDAVVYAGFACLLPVFAVAWVAVIIYEVVSDGRVSDCARGEESR